MGLKLAVGTVLVLMVVSLALAAEGLRRQRSSLLASKRVAAEMVTELFASALIAPLDFNDAEAIAAEARRIRTSRDVLALGVWEVPPAAALAGGEGLTAPVVTEPRVEIAEGYLDVLQPVRKENGRVVGVTRVRFSLEPENRSYEESRGQIFSLAAVTAALTAMALLLLARLQVVGPLRALVAAARATEAGVARVRVPVRANDELGQLGAAFNRMITAIDDRERRLAEASTELQQVLDHTGQAIVVIGPDGRISGVHSREAERILGPALPGQPVTERLYPGAPASDLERRAFAHWLEHAPDVSDDDWEEYAALAPRELHWASDGGEARALTLEVRRLPVAGQPPAMMLLITDITAQRHLERVVARQEAEHARQLAAMRHLAAAGGHLFAAFLEDARARLHQARQAQAEGLPAAQLEPLRQALHTLKGEARSFGLDPLAAVVHEMEGELQARRGGPARASVAPPAPAPGAALAPARPAGLEPRVARGLELLDEAERLFVEASPVGRLALEQVPVQRADVEALAQLVGGRDDALGALVERLSARPFGESVVWLTDSAQSWAQGLGKRVRLEVTGRDVAVPGALSRGLPGLLGHLVRNALVHSLETVERRAELGKPPTGTVALECAAVADGVVIRVEDDGGGVDEEAVRERARALGLDSSRPAAELMFASGLSTAAESDLLAGRGVGLAAVREECRRAGYDVTLASLRPARFVLRPSHRELSR